MDTVMPTTALATINTANMVLSSIMSKNLTQLSTTESTKGLVSGLKSQAALYTSGCAVILCAAAFLLICHSRPNFAVMRMAF